MDLFVARQPIFDRHRHVVGYELLFRSSRENIFGKNDPNKASLKMMDTTLLGFGLDALVGDKPAFFNATREVLVREHWAVLPPAKTVIEVLETVEPDAEVVGACLGLKKAGYQLALDDFVFRPEYEPLLELADIIKVDFLLTKGAERKRLADVYGTRGVQMLAEKVETHEEFEAGLAAGYTLFQGYFFCKPEMVLGKDVPALKANLVRLLQEVNRPEVSFDRLEDIVKGEMALSVRLLRYLHSAGFGWRHDIGTISQALRVLGERPTRKWASLVALTLIGDDKPPELVTTSLVRAQFCEELGNEMALPDRPADLFLIGLLSLLDAMLDRPLPEIVSAMSLSEEIHTALLGGDSLLSEVLQLASSYDRADWYRVTHLANRTAIPEPRIPDAYRRAVEWVTAIQNG